MHKPVVLLLRHRHDAGASRELLEMAAALAVFALPVTVLALAPPERLLDIDDADVAQLLADLPGYGTVSLESLGDSSQGGFHPVSRAQAQAVLEGAATVIGD
jgi:hypothetical protein